MTKQEVLEQANLIEGMMLDEEMSMLYDFIWNNLTEEPTLEIGAYMGKTSYLFCKLQKIKYGEDKVRHYALDVFDEGVEDNIYAYQPHGTEMWLKNLAEFHGGVFPIQSRSCEPKAWKEVMERRYSMVFVDGDHRYPNVYQDLLLADTVSDIILGHDYGHEGVTKSVDLFCQRRGYRVNAWRTPYGLFNITKN